MAVAKDQPKPKDSKYRDLRSFLKGEEIALDAYARMLTRVLVVCPVNQSLKGKNGDPFLCLLTNRADVSKSYAANFDAVEPIDFKRWVERFRPAVAYCFKPEGPFQRVEPVAPRSRPDACEGDLLSQRSLLLIEATATSSQRDPLLAPVASDGHFLGAAESERGYQVFVQIRTALRTLCGFIPRLGEVHAAFSQLFSNCLGEEGLPAYAEGQVLPPGLLSAVTELLFDENDDRAVALDAVDLEAAPWKPLDARGRANLAHVVAAFRDAVIGRPARQYDHLDFSKGRLSELARAALDPELQSSFRKAREAHGRLVQILRSKPLLSMILEWILKTYYRADVVKGLPAGRITVEHDNAVRDAILEGRPGVVAMPRPSLCATERTRFSASLVANFEELVKALLGDEHARERLRRGVPEIAEVAAALEQDGSLRESLTTLYPIGDGAQAERRRSAFLIGVRTLILCKLCPELYRTPVLTWQQLREMLVLDAGANFVSAVLLEERSEAEVRAIGRRHRALFEAHVDVLSRTIRGENEVQAPILKELVPVFVNARVAAEVEKYSVALENVQRPLFGSSRRVPTGAILTSERAWMALDGRRAHDVDPATALAIIEGRVEAAFDARSLPARGPDALPMLPASCERTEERAAIAAAIEDAERLDGAAEASGDQRKALIVARAARTLARDPAHRLFAERVRKDLTIHEQGLALIFQRYGANPDALEFRQRVERMLLEALMLQQWQKLGLGETSSNLYLLLIDLVLELDPERPEAFLRQHSLTEYFDSEHLKDDGLTRLRTLLESQALRTFSKVVDFVSEIRGIQYLFDKLAGSDRAEIVFVNATADEFLRWFKRDNLTPNEHQGRMRAGRLRRGEDNTERAIHPSAIYVSESAFGPGGSKSWLRSLSQLELVEQKLAVVIPPICLSLPAQLASQRRSGEASSEGYSRVGDERLECAEGAPAPVYLIGPSPHLNDPQSGFPTFLPAGYVFLAHLLGADVNGLEMRAVPGGSRGRKLLIGHGTPYMARSLAGAMRGSGEDGCIGFDADHFLYVVLSLYATARFSGARVDELGELKAFLKNFDSSNMNQLRYGGSIDALAPALRSGGERLYALDSELRDAAEYAASAVPTPIPTEHARWFAIAARKLGFI